MAESVRAGADIVTFSGDKLLGGPQAGLLAGRSQWLEPLKRHPLARAMRVDKMTIAALRETLYAYTDEELACREIPVLAMLGAKSHLRNDRPLVLAVSTNDGLGAAAQNIGRLLNVRNIYFVPFGQDDPVKKPRSLVADFSQIPRTIAAALSGVQMQPMLSYGAEGEAPTLH